MSPTALVSENRLDDWVRGNAEVAKGAIVELIRRLVSVSCPRPEERRFPLGDSINQHGPDGVLVTQAGFEPFVPDGHSMWEIGTGIGAGTKATTDYDELTAAVPENVRTRATFVFCTPLSGRRDWQHTWKTDQQIAWRDARREKKEWRDVRVIDGTVLVDWLSRFPAVEDWLGLRMELPMPDVKTPERLWASLRSIGEPPPLTPELFLVSRAEALGKLQEVFAKPPVELRIDTRYPEQVADFVSAGVAAMEANEQLENMGRCLILSSEAAWNSITSTLDEPHVLVADFGLDDAEGLKLLQRARQGGHSVIYGGLPGGLPHGNRVDIPVPKTYQVKDALTAAGYKEERARTLAHKSDGDLGALLRCLQGLSAAPEWAEDSPAADLVVAQLLGSWDERRDGDRAVVERLAGKDFGEWISEMRDVALRPSAPLSHRDGKWRVTSRYEAWYALGPRLFDDHLDKFVATAVDVLRERDPQFTLDSEQRFLAGIHGQILEHSSQLRKGVAETLALLGSHPDALTSVSIRKAQVSAVLGVRGVLGNPDWVLWASLSSLLPLLAEASPNEFLTATEDALSSSPSPLEELFAQETGGLGGANHMSGLLWALETIAWEDDHLSRAMLILGDLAERDPGGSWSNRPANSLTSIVLPWFPQTIASPARRRASVMALTAEMPSVGWSLLLSLLPQSHQVAMPNRRPVWRESIPSDWTTGVTRGEYREDVEVYTEIAIELAIQDLAKLSELVERLDDVSPDARGKVLAFLSSDLVTQLSDEERYPIWDELLDLVVRHRKYSDADWALPSTDVQLIDAAASALAPNSPGTRHRRLFGERAMDLYEEKGNYSEQEAAVEALRRAAVDEVFAAEALPGILALASASESPWRVGIAFGQTAPAEVDSKILPRLMGATSEPVAQFAGGFVRGRFFPQSWEWVDGVDSSSWANSEIGLFLSYLPFDAETWARAERLLAKNQSDYWTRASVNPYEAKGDLSVAVEKLIAFGRPHAAIQCVSRMMRDGQEWDSSLAAAALVEGVESQEGPGAIDSYDLPELIAALQERGDLKVDLLRRIEWMYLPLLDVSHSGVPPRALEQQLAEEPKFFCKVIGLVFRSRNEAAKPEDATATEEDPDRSKIAENAYRLLSRWKRPPGTVSDNSFDGEALSAWLAQVEKETTNSGHFEVAMSHVGQVLASAPPSPGGLWIHEDAARELNTKNHERLREGFTIALLNSRGVYGFSGGQAERDLAHGYRDKAEALELAGYSRLAAAVRNIATSYERDAERDETRDILDE